MIAPALTCAEAEALLAEQVLAEGDTMRKELAVHLDGCAACLRLARELDDPAVADELSAVAEELGGPPAELGEVAREHYVRGREIGRGGMGRIVRARDRRLGRLVAIKELLDERLRARFEREARLTARLQHPAIVSVHEAGRWPDGTPFYAMKYVAGRPLSRVIADTPALRDRLALLPNLITVVEAIAYAHSERVIHRDLKPHNIVLGAFGETVVIDWGLAKELGADDLAVPDAPYRGGELLTVAGSGTPAYMPPEQARGEAVDARADVFALGATLHHLLAGRPPGERELPRDAPAELAAIVARATAPDPAARYADGAELAAELGRYQRGQLVGAHRYTAWELARRFVRRHRAIVVASALFAAALAAVGVVSVSRVVAAGRRAEDAARAATHALAQSQYDRGRQLAVGGEPLRAYPYLHAALAAGLDTPELRLLLGQARRSAAALRLAIPLRASAVALAPDGKTVAAGGPGLVLYDVDTGARRLALVPDDAPASEIVWSPDGRRLGAVTGWPMAFRVWEVDGTLTGVLPAPPPRAKIHQRAFSADGTRVEVGAGDELYVYAASGSLLEVRRLAAPLPEVNLPAPARVVVNGRVVNLLPADIGDHRGAIAGEAGFSVAWGGAPGARRIATVGDDGLMVWDVARGEVLAERVDPGAVDAGFDAHGRLVTARHAALDVATLWEARGGRRLATVSAAAGRPPGELAVVARGDGTMGVASTAGWYWSAATGLLRDGDRGRGEGPRIARRVGSGALLASIDGDRGDLERITLTRRVTLADISADGVLVAALEDANARRVVLFQTRSGVERAHVDAPFEVSALRLTPDGTRLLIAGRQGQLLLCATDGRRLAALDGHAAQIGALATSGDGRFALTSSIDGARLWSLDSGELLWSANARGTVALDEHATLAYVGGSVFDLTPDPRPAGEIAADLARVPFELASGRVLPRSVRYPASPSRAR